MTLDRAPAETSAPVTWQRTDDDAILPKRNVWRAMFRGLRARCPNCGEGKMFNAFLKVAPQCNVCGEDLSHQCADDAPPYFVIFITGHVVVPASLSVEFNYAPPYWLHLVLWLPLTLGMAIGLLTPVKGAVVGLQWAFRMHGFGGNADDGLAIVPVTTAANTNESK